MTNLTGATLTVDLNAAPPVDLVRTATGWMAKVPILKAGTYHSGLVYLPDATTMTWRLPMLQFFAKPGELWLHILDSDETGAELLQRMMALAA